MRQQGDTRVCKDAPCVVHRPDAKGEDAGDDVKRWIKLLAGKSSRKAVELRELLGETGLDTVLELNDDALALIGHNLTAAEASMANGISLVELGHGIPLA